LAGDGIRPNRLGCEGAVEDDCDERNVPPVLEKHRGAPAARSREPPAGARPERPVDRRCRSRPGPRDRRDPWEQDRWTVGQALSTGWHLEGAELIGGLRPEPRGGFVSTQSVYLLEADRSAADDGQFRCVEPGKLCRAAECDEYAAAGARFDEQH